MNRKDGNGWLLALAGAGLAYGALTMARRSRSYSLRGKNVLVTGGSRGLGLVLARQLVHEGARVAVCARNEAELERAGDELRALGGTVVTVRCDVTERADVEAMIVQVRQQLGTVDVLINNAGIISVGPMETMTVEDYRDAMDTHFWGPLYTTLAVLPEMKCKGEGRIVNVSSIGGKIGVPHLAPYSASKFALVGLSQALRSELAKDGITVTSVCPGLMRTGSPRHATFKGQHRAEYAWFSISDSLPVLSISAESAARQIITACKRGEAESIPSSVALFGARMNALFPELVSDLLSVAGRLLPAPGGIGTRRAEGKDSQSAASPSILTALTEAAARRNNEMM